jgi:hypothetical protein
MSRDRILGRLRGLHRTGAPPADRIPPPPRIRDLRDRFQVEAEKVGTVVLTGMTVESALSRILAELDVATICWLGMDLFGKHDIPSLLDPLAEFSEGKLIFSDHPDRVVRLPIRLRCEPYNLDRLAEVAVSVGTADCGIAETGTTVESAAREGGRVGAILPPVHVVLLRGVDLMGDHFELFSKTDLSTSGSARVLMTGPSRTADIEKILILGVHGPKRLYVVLTD